jgi:hypothetical protein
VPDGTVTDLVMAGLLFVLAVLALVRGPRHPEPAGPDSAAGPAPLAHAERGLALYRPAAGDLLIDDLDETTP